VLIENETKIENRTQGGGQYTLQLSILNTGNQSLIYMIYSAKNLFKS